MKPQKQNKTEEYRVDEICNESDDTQDLLNERAKQGWQLVCSYHYGNWLIFKRRVIKCEFCGK